MSIAQVVSVACTDFIIVVDDPFVEGLESFSIAISSPPVPYSVSFPDPATVFIIDNESKFLKTNLSLYHSHTSMLGHCFTF